MGSCASLFQQGATSTNANNAKTCLAQTFLIFCKSA